MHPRGVVSPWLRNIIYKVHERIAEEDGIGSVGYVDDTVLYMMSGDLDAAIKTMNEIAIPIAQHWAEEFGLEIARDKTVAVVYTTRQKKTNKNGKIRKTYDDPPPIEFLGEEVEWSDQHKHLGVVIQKKLNSQNHIKDKIKKAHLSNGPSDLKQNGTQEKTPFYITVFNTLSHGAIRFVASGSS